MGEELPVLPSNVVHVTRRIRRCESDTPAQVVLEHFAIEYARNAVAPYAERIRQLERELAERKTASIDSPEFRALLRAHAKASEERFSRGDQKAVQAERVTRDSLIAYIDGRTAGAAVQPKDTPESMAASNARFAIDGAIQYGRESRNAPPSDDHWLYEYWNIGQQLRELGATGWDNITPLENPDGCRTCGGSRVDPGGLPTCRDCEPYTARVAAQEGWHIERGDDVIRVSNRSEGFATLLKDGDDPRETVLYRYFAQLAAAPTPMNSGKEEGK
jgi:hypothetical protein